MDKFVISAEFQGELGWLGWKWYKDMDGYWAAIFTDKYYKTEIEAKTEAIKL